MPLCPLSILLMLLYARRNEELTRLTQRIVEFGLRGGWAEFEGTPLQLPRVQLVPPQNHIDLRDSDSDPPSDSKKS